MRAYRQATLASGRLAITPDARASGQRQREINGFLIGDAHRGLESVEAAALDRIPRRPAVTAIADVARPAPLPRPLERLDHVALLELGQRAAMELDEVDVIGGEPFETPLDALEQRPGAPIATPPAIAVPALGEEVIFRPPAPDRPPDQLLAGVVALRRVDHVEAGVERGAQEPRDSPLTHALVADLGSAEAEHAHVHVRLSQSPSLHANPPNRTVQLCIARGRGPALW